MVILSSLSNSIPSKRLKEELFRGSQSLPLFRQQKNGHPVSWETVRSRVRHFISLASVFPWQSWNYSFCWGEKFSFFKVVIAKMGYFPYPTFSIFLLSGYINGETRPQIMYCHHIGFHVILQLKLFSRLQCFVLDLPGLLFSYLDVIKQSMK